MKPPLHITADKKEIKDFPKLPSATSFIRKALGERASWNIILRKGTIGNNDKNEYK